MSTKTAEQKRWFVFGLIAMALVAVLCVGNSFTDARSQPVAEYGAFDKNNIMVVPIQLGTDGSSGIVMVDLAKETLWVYEITAAAGSRNRLQLIAARTYKYDRGLEQYNTAEPRPQQVKMLLERIATDQYIADEKVTTTEKVSSDSNEQIKYNLLEESKNGSDVLHITGSHRKARED